MLANLVHHLRLHSVEQSTHRRGQQIGVVFVRRGLCLFGGRRRRRRCFGSPCAALATLPLGLERLLCRREAVAPSPLDRSTDGPAAPSCAWVSGWSRRQDWTVAPALRPGTKIQGKVDRAPAGNEQAQWGSPDALVKPLELQRPHKSRDVAAGGHCSSSCSGWEHDRARGCAVAVPLTFVELVQRWPHRKG